MLELLHIENIAVIETADIAFQPGFNALTGETGAGKSIVIDAMGAVLGGRASRDLIRTGVPKACVSAVFSHVPADLPGLAENGIAPDEDGNLLLQREMTVDGKNTCRVNGLPLTVTQLRQIGAELLNIHGQHDGQQLLDEEQHGAYLDRFGRMDAPLAAYRKEYAAMAALREQIRTALPDYEDLYTLEGVRRSVRRLTGREPILIEPFQVSPNRPDCRDPALYRRLYGEDPYRFFVLLPEDTFSGQKEREQFQRDMEEVIPAGMTMQMIQLKPCIQLDWHTYLGINARIGGYVPAVIDEQATIHYDTTIGGANHE